MKNGLIFFWVLITAQVFAQPVTILESAGWLESAYIKWMPVEGAERYHVYVSGEQMSESQLDDPLIREYENGFRADAVGLSPGTYTFRIAPVIGGIEKEKTLSPLLTVTAHDRTGFAFSGGICPGAYRPDGMLREGAVVVYVTENTKDSVILEVVGANENPCIGFQAILDGFKKGKDFRPLVIRLVGQITDPEFLYKGDIVMENDNQPGSFITIEGIGDDAVADGWGLRLKNASNVEVRNLAWMNVDSQEGDNISLQQDNDHIWVHHCDFFYGEAGNDADQVKGDGALDCKRSGFVTIAYNHFWDTGKTNLLGNGVEDPRLLTYHHNWYDHSDSRHPRVRSHSVHVYNNYFDGIAKYGIGATLASSVFVEANYFRNCPYPMLISMQGSDVFDETTQSNDYIDKPTFSKEDGGMIKAFQNLITGQHRLVPYGDMTYPASTVDFDAFVVNDRDEKLPGTVVSHQGGNVYTNFDTDPLVMYTYSPDLPEIARQRVLQWSGRMFGGDFQWDFDDAAADASYDPDPELKAALQMYETGLVSIQGEANSGNGGETESDLIHNFTVSGKNSQFYQITGNLSDSKGTVYYDGLTLTQCLKMESTTLIRFTLTDSARLTLVFNPEFSGRIRIDGMEHYAEQGVLERYLDTGYHEITKGDVANLYYIRIDYLTAITRQEETPDILVFPNPVSARLQLQSDSEIEWTGLYRITGEQLRTWNYPGNSLELDFLEKGLYLLQLTTTHGNRIVWIDKE